MTAALPIRMEAQFLEAAVLAWAAMCDPTREVLALYHHERERLYNRPSEHGDDRPWLDHYERWFERSGMREVLLQAIEEQPELKRLAKGVRVLLAYRGKDEGAELFEDSQVSGSPEASRVLLLRMRAESLLDAPRALRTLRIDLTHVSDMLDPEFAYDPRALEGIEPAKRSLLLDRTMLLWGISVRCRIPGFFREDADHLVDRTRANLLRAFRNWTPERAERLLDELRSRRRPPFRALLDQARFPQQEVIGAPVAATSPRES
ncbi:MAG TPA: hypothetical protein PKA37_07320 [Planctomycetota bacterium]|jgi:hypothetical protein|nr:hypothetical protein [Planctomycetota bacterium]